MVKKIQYGIMTASVGLPFQHESYRVGGVDLAWDLSAMDGSGYACRNTLIEGEGLACMPAEVGGQRGYKAMIGLKEVSGTLNEMPDGAMFEAEEAFKALHPILPVPALETLLTNPLLKRGFAICGFIESRECITFSAWGKRGAGELYGGIKSMLKGHPVTIKIVPVFDNPTVNNKWFTVRIQWEW